MRMLSAAIADESSRETAEDLEAQRVSKLAILLPDAPTSALLLVLKAAAAPNATEKELRDARKQAERRKLEGWHWILLCGIVLSFVLSAFLLWAYIDDRDSATRWYEMMASYELRQREQGWREATRRSGAA